MIVRLCQGVCLATVLLGSGAAAEGSPLTLEPRVPPALARGACEALRATMRAPSATRRAPLALSPLCADASSRDVAARARTAARTGDLPSGSLVDRQRLAGNGVISLDLVAYMSSGLVVAGLLCYPDDGVPRSAVIHVPGGGGGVFAGGAGDMVQTCIDWAALHGRTAFAPSLRGNDGGEGEPELCLGEADDVVAAAQMLRSLPDVVDPARLGLVGGSIGGCVVLRAAPHIPNLAAVVAFVPPTSWKELIQYHRTAWQPGVEAGCSGEPREWTIGGPAFADALESIICGHAACSDAEFLARTPLTYVSVQSAPTLIVSAEHDNVVPLVQQLLWSLFRQSLGHPVSVFSVDPCAPPGTPPLGMDVHVLVRGAFHLLSPSSISSGMLFLMGHLDRIPPSAGR